MVTELRKRGDELFRHRRAELERAGAALERERAKLKEATTAEERARSTEECAHSAKLLSELVEAGDDDRGTNLERAREAVSESLAGHEAAGSPDTIKASYELIEAAGGEQATFESFRKERERRQEQWKRPWKRGKRG
jgi:hypothetical protein